MLTTFKKIVFRLGLVPTIAFSSTPNSAPLSLPEYWENTCIVNPKDSFEPNVRLEVGPLKGLCVNPLQRRSAQILTLEQASKYFLTSEIQDSDLVVANFSHQGNFWVAKIPVQKVEKMILQVEYFPTGPGGVLKIAHSQFRINFQDGATVDLVPQIQNTSNSEPQDFKSATTNQRIRLNELLFSVENIGPYGEKFDPVKGMKKHYNIAYRLVSLEDKYKWMIEEQNHTVLQHLLNLSPADVQRFLRRVLDEAQHYSTRRSYHTFTANCVTEPFILLDEVMGIENQTVPQIPNFARAALRNRGLLDTKTKTPTLNEEYEKRH